MKFLFRVLILALSILPLVLAQDYYKVTHLLLLLLLLLLPVRALTPNSY